MAKRRRKHKRRRNDKQQTNEKHNVAAEPIIGTSLPKDRENAPDHQQADSEHKVPWTVPKQLKKLKTWSELAVIFGVAGLVYQSCEMQRSNEIATSALIANRQPALYVVPLNQFQFGGDNPNNGDILWRFRRINYGQFPAVDVNERFRVIYAPDTNLFPLIEEFFNSLPDRLARESTSIGGSVEPPRNDSYPNILIASSQPITKQQYTDAMDSVARLALVGRFEYSDLIGNRYVTDFCFMRNRGGEIWACHAVQAGQPTRNRIAALEPRQ